jgi:hypothetical protein
MTDQPLMDYFRFDTDDLYANQNGRFTDKQKANLIAQDKSRRKSGLGLGIFLAVVGLIGPIIAIIAGIANPDPGFIIGFGLGFGLIWPLVWGGIGYLMIKSAFEKREFNLAQVQGRANIIARESTDSDGHHHTYFELHIGGHTFGARQDMADVIMQGDEYIVYYVPSTDDIVSVEPITKRK